MKRKFLAWLSRLRWRLVRKLGGEMPGDRVLVARSINPGLCRVEQCTGAGLGEVEWFDR